MTLLVILKLIALLGTIATGALALFRPLSTQGFTGLSAPGGRGVTEIRAVLGGLFIALGLAPMIFAVPATYQMLGVAYLGVAIVRIPSMFVDKSVVQSNIISAVVEVAFGLILLA